MGYKASAQSPRRTHKASAQSPRRTHNEGAQNPRRTHNTFANMGFADWYEEQAVLSGAYPSTRYGLTRADLDPQGKIDPSAARSKVDEYFNASRELQRSTATRTS